MCQDTPHTLRSQCCTGSNTSNVPVSFLSMQIIREGFIGIGCLIKEKTDFSKHPVNARKREEWKGNERNNLERRTEKKETLAPGERADHSFSPAFIYRRCLLLLITEKMWCVSWVCPRADLTWVTWTYSADHHRSLWPWQWHKDHIFSWMNYPGIILPMY